MRVMRIRSVEVQTSKSSVMPDTLASLGHQLWRKSDQAIQCRPKSATAGPGAMLVGGESRASPPSPPSPSRGFRGSSSLTSEKGGNGLSHHLPHVPEELGGIGPVQDAMIADECERQHRARLDGPRLANDWTQRGGAHAADGGLRRGERAPPTD